jgi:serine protease Do
MKDVRGVLVSQMAEGGPAERAGLKPGDVILELNGTAVNDVNALRNRVAAAGATSDVTLLILRGGNQQQVHVKLGEFRAEGTAAGGKTNGGEAPSGQIGLSVQPLTADIARQLGLPRSVQGLLVKSVDPGGPASSAGIEEGDVIEEINRQTVRSVDDMKSALQASGDRPALLLVNRKGQTIFVPVRAR